MNFILLLLVFSAVNGDQTLTELIMKYKYNNTHYGANQSPKPLLFQNKQAELLLKLIYGGVGDKIFNEKDWGVGYTPSDDKELLNCFIAVQNFTTNTLRYPFWQMMDSSA